MTLGTLLSHSPLQRGAGLTAWRQIADHIEAMIAAGTYPPSARLPSEAEFAARFQVNRHTVRRALAALAGRGLVRAAQGGGTFVEASPLAYPIGPKTRFSQAVAHAGREARGELIDSAEAEADTGVAEALGLAVGAPVLHLTTLHRADDIPISIAYTWLPLPRFAGIEASYRRTGSLTQAYVLHGVSDYSRLRTRISARTVAGDEARHLDLAAGRVVLVTDSVNVDSRGERIQATRSMFAADRVDLEVEA